VPVHAGRNNWIEDYNISKKKKNGESINKCILHAFMEIVILPILCPPACLNIVDLDMKLTTLLLGEILFVFLMGLTYTR
jgi:hypothetical protein